MSTKVRLGLGLFAVPALALVLVGCGGSDSQNADSSPAVPTNSASMSAPATEAAVDGPDLGEACRLALEAMPSGSLPADQKLVAAAGDLQDVIEAANNVDVTFALDPMVQALYAQATAQSGQASVDAMSQYLDSIEALHRACKPAGVTIIRK